MGYSATLTQLSGPIVVTRPALVVDMLETALSDRTPSGWGEDMLKHLRSPEPVAALIGAARCAAFHAYAGPEGSVLITGREEQKLPSFWPSWWGCLSAGVDTETVWQFLGEEGREWLETLTPEKVPDTGPGLSRQSGQVTPAEEVWQ